jgi:protocatechuate 3,4-dioxygenase beta subunit
MTLIPLPDGRFSDSIRMQPQGGSQMSEQKEGKRRITRRQALGLMGGAALAAAVGCGDDEPSSTATPSATRTSAGTTPARTTAAPAATATAEPVACIVTPELTEGPYFVDERLNRADIRSDPTTGEVSEGVPLQLALTVLQVQGSSCTPISGAAVDMWHCDALGVYSDVSGAGQTDTTGQKFLRGYQLTDSNGRVQFQTIFPGWYRGRTPHIHFKVRTDPDAQAGSEFTSQLFFSESTTAAVYSQAPYNTKGQADTTNSTDGIFREEMVLALNQQGGGYAGSYHVGVSA